MHIAQHSIALSILLLAGCGGEAASESGSISVEASAPSSEAALHPSEVLDIHLGALSPTDAGWRGNLEQLARIGDRFTLSLLDDDDLEQLPQERRSAALELRAQLVRKLPTEDRPLPAEEVQGLLERAAWADLVCHGLERKLVPWTQGELAAHVDDPGVRAELERIQADYEPAIDGGQLGYDHVVTTMQKRVPTYVARVLGD